MKDSDNVYDSLRYNMCDRAGLLPYAYPAIYGPTAHYDAVGSNNNTVLLKKEVHYVETYANLNDERFNVLENYGAPVVIPVEKHRRRKHKKCKKSDRCGCKSSDRCSCKSSDHCNCKACRRLYRQLGY